MLQQLEIYTVISSSKILDLDLLQKIRDAVDLELKLVLHGAVIAITLFRWRSKLDGCKINVNSFTIYIFRSDFGKSLKRILMILQVVKLCHKFMMQSKSCWGKNLVAFNSAGKQDSLLKLFPSHTKMYIVNHYLH